MRFGDLPDWASMVARLVCEAVSFGEALLDGGTNLIADDQCAEEPYLLPLDLLWREPLFDQLIVNRYKPGEVCLRNL